MGKEIISARDIEIGRVIKREGIVENFPQYLSNDNFSYALKDLEKIYKAHEESEHIVFSSVSWFFEKDFFMSTIQPFHHQDIADFMFHQDQIYVIPSELPEPENVSSDTVSLLAKACSYDEDIISTWFKFAFLYEEKMDTFCDSSRLEISTLEEGLMRRLIHLRYSENKEKFLEEKKRLIELTSADGRSFDFYTFLGRYGLKKKFTEVTSSVLGSFSCHNLRNYTDLPSITTYNLLFHDERKSP